MLPHFKYTTGCSKKTTYWIAKLIAKHVVDRGIVKVTPCHSHHVLLQVEDDVVDCNTIQDEKCEAETIGYTTQNKCTKWPRYIEEDC